MKMNKKQIGIALVCFLAAIVFLVTSIIPHKYQDGKVIESTQKKTEEVETIRNNVGNADSIEHIASTELAESLGETEEEREYPIYQEDFKLENLNEELLPFVGNDTTKMIESIQKTLYENGFYDYSSAVFENIVEFDYLKNTITFSFSVKANKEVNISLIYYREAQEWITQIW